MLVQFPLWTTSVHGIVGQVHAHRFPRQLGSWLVTSYSSKIHLSDFSVTFYGSEMHVWLLSGDFRVG